MSRLAPYLIAVVLCAGLTVLGTILWGRTLLQDHTALAYRVGNPSGVERLDEVDIGGLKQWIHIRGQDKRNPVLLYLHGGPGAPKIGTQDMIQRPWEDYFTVVHWDQRQTGKSYYSMDEIGETMTLERMVADAEEVVAYLRRTLGHEKIVVLGHSWGTVLGMYLVKRKPEWIHAYIGVAQMVNKQGNEAAMWRRLWPIAEARGETAVLARMKEMAPYPDPANPSRGFTENENGRFLRDQLNRLAGEAGSRYMRTNDVARMNAYLKFSSPLLTWRDLYNERFGGPIAQYDPRYKFIDDLMAEDLPIQLGSSFTVPIFFFTGAHDYHVSRDMTASWFEQISAPYKELVWFNEAAHAVPTDQPGAFLIALVDKVRPLTGAP